MDAADGAVAVKVGTEFGIDVGKDVGCGAGLRPQAPANSATKNRRGSDQADDNGCTVPEALRFNFRFGIIDVTMYMVCVILPCDESGTYPLQSL